MLFTSPIMLITIGLSAKSQASIWPLRYHLAPLFARFAHAEISLGGGAGGAKLLLRFDYALGTNNYRQSARPFRLGGLPRRAGSTFEPMS